VKAILKAEYYPYITKVGVFGSHARNEETETSDLDILIDYDRSSDDYLDNLGNFMEDMESAIHGKIDYVTVPGLMSSKDDWFRENVLHDVLWIYDSARVK